jgi:integrase
MSALTLKPVLHHRQRDNGTFQVRVRLTKDRKSVFLDAGFSVPAKHWNPKAKLESANWIRASEADAILLNSQLEKLVRDGRATGLTNPLLSAAEVRDLLSASARPAPPEPAAPDFIDFARQYVVDRGRTEKPNTVRFYYYTARDLAEWHAHKPLPFAELTEEKVRDFHAWLLAKPKIGPTTAKERIIKLGTIARQAVKRGLLAYTANPFVGLTLPSIADHRPERVPTEAEVVAVLGLDLTQATPTGAQNLQLRRDVWEFQLLTRGTRISDVLQLRERDLQPDRVVFTETKTGKTKGVKRTAAIDAILARYPASGNPLAYTFPLLDHQQSYAALNPTVEQQTELALAINRRTRYVNDGFLFICRMAGVPYFSSHSARHRFANQAWAKLKDLRMLQKMLNHSSPVITERYLKQLGVDDLDAATDAVWGI